MFLCLALSRFQSARACTAWVSFTKFSGASRIEGPAKFSSGFFNKSKLASLLERGALMAVVTGELIRAMNYVEDITATLRRICIYIPAMSPDERKRLAEAMRGAAMQVNAAIADLEKVEK